jgi:hypothetical protein
VLGRRYGLTADRLVGAELVTADGHILTCDDDQHADLLWCLRGGGAPGVVTALTFRPVPEPTVRAFELAWPARRAAAAVTAGSGGRRRPRRRVRRVAPRGRQVRLGGAVPGSDLAPLDDLVDRIGLAPAARSTPRCRCTRPSSGWTAVRGIPSTRS